MIQTIPCDDPAVWKRVVRELLKATEQEAEEANRKERKKRREGANRRKKEVEVRR